MTKNGLRNYHTLYHHDVYVKISSSGKDITGSLYSFPVSLAKMPEALSGAGMRFMGGWLTPNQFVVRSHSRFFYPLAKKERGEL